MSMPQAGRSVDPDMQRAQVRAQADILNALRGVSSTGTVAAQLGDGKGIDLYF